MRVFPYETTDEYDVVRGLLRLVDHGGAHPTRPVDGLGHAYRYRDRRTGTIRWAMDPVLADLASNGRYETVWVVYHNGSMDHIATGEEYQEELGARIGADVADTLTQQQLKEFESMEDDRDSVRWIIENVPNAREIVNRNRREMERAVVLDHLHKST